MGTMQSLQKRTGRKGLGATEQIMLLVVLVVVALILIWIAREYLLKRGGETVEGFIRGVNDFDGDGIPNNVDRCRPAACDPGDREEQIDRDADSPFYGCLPTQGVTLELYADTCGRREETGPAVEEAS